MNTVCCLVYRCNQTKVDDMLALSKRIGILIKGMERMDAGFGFVLRSGGVLPGMPHVCLPSA